jgi:hypothetical protein
LGGEGAVHVIKCRPSAKSGTRNIILYFHDFLLEFIKLMYYGKMMDISPSACWFSEININNFVKCVV